MKLSIQYIDENDQKFCFTHAVEITASANGYDNIRTEVVESKDEVKCLICSGEISIDDVFGEF